MKICLLFLFAFTFQLMALNTNAQDAVIELKTSSVTIGQLINEIEKQTDYLVVYSNREIDTNRKVNFPQNSDKVSSYLNTAFSNTDIGYNFENDYIVLSKKAHQNRININWLIETAQQQGRTITGKVTDENGEPVIGANIIEKGTSNGTVTDIDGYFSFIVGNEASLHISYIGYLAQDITTTGKTTFDIILQEDTKALEEVVVIGYGTQKVKDLTGSVSFVKGGTIQERRSTQLSDALQGTVSGVMVDRSNGAPGSGGSIKIRGITTIGNSNPLIIVDGIPASNINDINPNDVENISVLKDAASASIYGARAASGVIVITTKRGSSEKINLSYTSEFGIERATENPKYVNVVRFMQMANELTWNDAGNGADEYPTYSKTLIDDYYNLNKQDPDTYPITDWHDLLSRSSAPKQSHILSISGGTEAARTKASIIYNKVEGLYSADRSLERFTTRINNDFKIGKLFDASLDVNYKKSSYFSPIISPNEQMRNTPAIYPAIWTNGTMATGKSGNNPYAALMYGGRDKTTYDQLGGNGKINFKPIQGLIVTAAVAAIYNFEKEKNFIKRIPYYASDDPTIPFGYVEGYTKTKLTESRNDSHTITKQLYANYSKEIGVHSLGAMIGYEDFYGYYENMSAFKDEFELSNFPYLDVGPDNVMGASGNASENAYTSFFGRLTYGYADKYLFQANVRRDGSSRFAPGYRWGTFPSFSLGWVISEENFMKKVWPVSFLKLRASYGSLGNERIGNYPYQTSLNYSNALFYEGDKVVSKTTAAQWQYAIRDISWETTTSLDLGADATFFDNRLRLTFDYYDKRTKDMLLAIKIPSFVGYDNPEQNTGKMHTKGYDIEVSWNDRIGKVGYGISANLSDFKSKLGDLGGTQFLGDKIKEEGSEFDEWYGYVSDGIYQTDEEVANSPRLNDNVKPGDIRYKDISGPDGEPDGKISPEYDRVLLGGSLPRYLYGFNLTADWNGFDLSLTFQGVGKQWMKKNHMVVAYSDGWKNMPEIIDGKYWSNYNSPEQNEHAEYPRLTRSTISNNNALSDFWLFDGRYLRLKNATIGYTIPSHITNKMRISNLRVYATLTDLFSIDKYPEGWDPELGSIGSYPITSSYIFGLSVKF